MSPYRILGLDEDASETEIKRAYARLLKQHRPEEDPGGFQHLHEAYTLCLALRQARPSSSRRPPSNPAPVARVTAPEGVNDDPVRDYAFLSQFEPADSIDNSSDRSGTDEPCAPLGANALATAVETGFAHAPNASRDTPVARFHPASFLDELTRHAGKTTAPALIDWLHAHPALYSLDTKDSLAEPMVRHLNERPALPPEHLRALLNFFDLDTINPRAQRLQGHIERLYRRSAQASGDWEDVAYMYEQPRSSSSSRSGSHWWIWVLAFVLIRIIAASVSSP